MNKSFITNVALSAGLLVLTACGSAQFAAESFKKITNSYQTDGKNAGNEHNKTADTQKLAAENGKKQSKNQLTINPDPLPLEDKNNPIIAIYGRYKANKPYQINGVWYYPQEPKTDTERGVASWYGDDFHGKQTANGAIFDMNRVSAAHKTLPLPSVVKVTNLENGKTMKILVNDRGPYANGRIIDLSRKAAEIMGFNVKGTALVEVQYLSRETEELWNIVGGGPFAESAPTAAPVIGINSVTKINPEAKQNAKLKTPDNGIIVSTASADTIHFPTIANNQTTKDTQWQLAQAEKWKIDPKSLEQSVETTPLRSRPQLFIQVGAFSDYNNANKVRALLQPMGNVTINQNDTKLFRVRIGPIASIADAEQMVSSIHQSGYTDARIILVENANK